MKEIIMNFIIVTLFFFVGTAFGEVSTEDMDYTVDGTTYKGFLADGAPEGKKVPGVIVIHEWWGQNEYPRTRAKMLAEKGYVAFAIDLFGEGKTADHPKKAQEFASAAMKDPQKTKKVFDKALLLLKKRDDVDPDKIAVIGYCFGGGVALMMAAMGADVDLVASFHGSLSEELNFHKMADSPRILIFNGADDPFVTQEQIKSVKSSMDKARINYSFENYPGAKHAFTNPNATENGKKFGIPLAYNEKADKDSWNKLLQALGDL